MYLTLDSSIIVAGLREGEGDHKACKSLLEQVKDGKFIALESYIVLVEVTAAIKRRTNSEELAERVKKDLENLGTMFFLDLTKQRANEAADIARLTGVRGMDAIVIQIAKENEIPLVSLDKEMLDKARDIVIINDLHELVQ